MFASPTSARQVRGEPVSAAGRFLWSPHGKASRSQWWLGHLSAALLGCLGFLGGMGLVVSAAVQLGLEADEISFKLPAIAVATLCLLQFLVASNALCRSRLRERGKSHDLVDAGIGFLGLGAALMLNGGARTFMASYWPLPAAPQWLAFCVAILCLGSLVALMLECGVFERVSLTEIWRGRPRQALRDQAPLVPAQAGIKSFPNAPGFPLARE
jgi:uncharacterized membrane protein YhaH (DUF805 family)